MPGHPAHKARSRQAAQQGVPSTGELSPQAKGVCHSIRSNGRVARVASEKAHPGSGTRSSGWQKKKPRALVAVRLLSQEDRSESLNVDGEDVEHQCGAVHADARDHRAKHCSPHPLWELRTTRTDLS
eukprot:1800431-Pleurochrysis_carterae.AAC.9